MLFCGTSRVILIVETPVPDLCTMLQYNGIHVPRAFGDGVENSKAEG